MTCYWVILFLKLFFLGIKEELYWLEDRIYKKIGGQEILYTRTQKAIKKTYQQRKDFQSLNISWRETPLKRLYALHQIEAKHLILSHKTCLSENLSLNVRELCSNQILQTVTYIEHRHKDLASFLFPKPTELVKRNWPKVAGHTQHSPKFIWWHIWVWFLKSSILNLFYLTDLWLSSLNSEWRMSVLWKLIWFNLSTAAYVKHWLFTSFSFILTGKEKGKRKKEVTLLRLRVGMKISLFDISLIEYNLHLSLVGWTVKRSFQ